MITLFLSHCFFLLLFGSAHVIVTQYQDLVWLAPDPKGLLLHPYFVYQTLLMFSGEFICLIIVAVVSWIRYRKSQLATHYTLSPSTTLCISLGRLDLGLSFTSSLELEGERSPIQITGGAVFVFLETVFVEPTIRLSGFGGNPARVSSFHSLFFVDQYVLEERLLNKYHVSAAAGVGLEGLWGLVLFGLLGPILYFIPNPSGPGPLVDLPLVLSQVFADWRLWATSIASVVSVTVFNLAGLAITKSTYGAAARSTVDTLRALVVWTISLGVGWEVFSALQLAGFLTMGYGAALFTRLVPLVPCRRAKTSDSDVLIFGSGQQASPLNAEKAPLLAVEDGSGPAPPAPPTAFPEPHLMQTSPPPPFAGPSLASTNSLGPDFARIDSDGGLVPGTDASRAMNESRAGTIGSHESLRGSVWSSVSMRAFRFPFEVPRPQEAPLARVPLGEEADDEPFMFSPSPHAAPLEGER
ncbi:hypothetical protein PAPYR_3375 [Paratrimastix pyriformis]|uniref:Solute carrier family 35 member F6 n=1 Tax=Paratrimastix pyriformis TaxID=342808 RepID=A0ABQ8UMF6_9EUKA|nr:hypothetical protein PAPYR_3375 [Paratrimastix pyriformis]